MKFQDFKRILWLSIVFVSFCINAVAQTTSFQQLLEEIPEIVSIQKIDNNPFFEETYEVMVDQYLDHGNPQVGKFEQRVIISNYNKYSPIVFVTEGYRADYATKSTYINELSRIIETNQIVVEHRYFGKSTPEDETWQYLTIENATADLHRIYKIFSKIYNNKNKWIATGISKGGQNTIAYKAFYPEDMDIWVPYVGPVNFSVQDSRMDKFIKSVSNAKCRDLVYDFQLNVLKNRDAIQPILDSLIVAKEYTFAVSNEEILDYCVLEYSFSFWQWGYDCKEIPADTVSPREMFEYLISISGPDYFAIQEIEPTKAFFIQTQKEFGYYNYSTKEFEPYLKITSAENYVRKVFLSEEPTFKYSNKTSKFIKKTILKDGDHLLMIYGEYDPWTAGAIIPKGRCRAKMFVKPKGSHRTRISNMSYAQQTDIYILLEQWLEED